MKNGLEKTVTVVSVKSDALNIVKTVTFKAENGKKISAEAYSETVEGIAPIRDFEYARSNFMGKTLWLKRAGLGTWDSSTQQFGSVKAKRCSAVSVTGVVAGWYDHQPIRLILKTASGETGFIDTSFSGTNIPHGLRQSGFEERFFTSDPRLTHNWPVDVWDAIEKESVFVNMTSEQAILSWGSPKKVNRTTTGRGAEEQWVYGTGTYLYVRKGIVTAIQN
jgi:hypothetical protein